MINPEKLTKICQQRQMGVEELAGRLVRVGFNKKQAISAINNWQKGLLKPALKKEDLQRLAEALSVEVNDLSQWESIYRYAPSAPRKARLVAQLISGRSVQEAMDLLKFTRKRAAYMINKVLKSAVADADEQQADVDNLYVNSARIDEAGTRIGTKRWIAKDRGRAHPISQKACHIHVSVTEA
jgi:large subunit ribosomal protein L22